VTPVRVRAVTPVRVRAASAERRGHRPAALAVALALLAPACGGDRPEPAASGEQVPDRPAAAERGPAPGGDQRRARDARPARPAALEIPAIGVRAPVIRLGLNDDRTLEVPEDYSETGWWSGGYAPGQDGPAVIAGHVDSKDGPAVFYELDELGPGDEIRVARSDGSIVRFAVERIERHPKDGFPTRAVYGRTARPTLRLITCSGDFDESTGHYVDNTIVFASLRS
jgi:LPXTG-site transpeptidase (sortase) family protein